MIQKHILHAFYKISLSLFCHTSDTSSAAQCGGGSFKNRSPIGEVSCCDAWMAEGTDGWTGGWGIVFVSPSLSLYLSSTHFQELDKKWSSSPKRKVYVTRTEWRPPFTNPSSQKMLLTPGIRFGIEVIDHRHGEFFVIPQRCAIGVAQARHPMTLRSLWVDGVLQS